MVVVCVAAGRKQDQRPLGSSGHRFLRGCDPEGQTRFRGGWTVLRKEQCECGCLQAGMGESGAAGTDASLYLPPPHRNLRRCCLPGETGHLGWELGPRLGPKVLQGCLAGGRHKEPTAGHLPPCSSEYQERVRSHGQQLQQLQAELNKLRQEVARVRAAHSEVSGAPRLCKGLVCVGEPGPVALPTRGPCPLPPFREWPSLCSSG